MPLRVATLNLWNKSGPWAERMESARVQLAELAPDILGLQEVLELRPPGALPPMNQADELRPPDWETFHRAYGASHEISSMFGGEGGPALWFGNAVVSPHPIVRHEALPIPGAEESDQVRTLLHAVVATPAHGEVDVFVTHLNWKLHEGAIREQQVKAIARLIAERAPDDGRYPPLLMGDMNAEPISDEIRYLGGYTRLGEPRSVRFADVWAYRPGNDPGYTFDPVRNPFAAQYPEPPRRIDYLFVRGPASTSGQTGQRASVPGMPLHVARCFDRELPVFPSDHFGVFADLV